MKFKSSKTAFTLIELIVSLVLVGIVLLGIISISTVLSNNNQDYGQRYLVKADTQTTLNHILNNASLAVGSGTSDSFGNQDLGILHGFGLQADGNPGVGDANSFCIHQAPNNNILGSAAAIWLCYTYNADQIHWCTSTYTPATGANSFRGAAAPCTGGSANYTFLGSAFSMSLPSGPTFTDNQATNSLQFSITITNCLDDTVASCNAGAQQGTSSDPVNNPEVQISGSVTPLQEGI